MSEINIASISGSMSASNSVPIVIVSVSIYNDTGEIVEFDENGFQYSTDDGSTWYDGTISDDSISSFNTSTATAGQENSFYWLVKTDLPNISDTVQIRAAFTDGTYYSGYASADVVIKTTKPTLFFDIDDYVNNASVTVAITKSTDALYYRYRINSGTYSSWSSSSTSYVISLGSSTGTKFVEIQARDQYYNTSEIASDTTVLYVTVPQDAYGKLIGTVTGNTTYTGIVIGDDGSFSPDRSITIEFYAASDLNLQVRITGDIETDLDWTDYNLGGDDLFNEYSAVLVGYDYNYDSDRDITVDFKDQAGNTSSVDLSIRLNTRIFNTANKNLREPDASYDHQLLVLNSSGYTEIITQSETSDDEYSRVWDDIFYPTSHSYPTDSDGNIDEQACIDLGGTSTTDYDAVSISDGAVDYDDELRPTTVDWTTDGTKDYNNLISSYSDNIQFWVIDNDGYGDPTLEFEYFYLNANSYGPPYNTLAPYRCDCLVIYNADDVEAITETIGADGTVTYTLNDTSKLEEMYAYTGEGSDVIELSEGYAVNASATGAFDVDLTGVTRVCIIFYSDVSMTSSGFKLKGGPKHAVTYTNFDVDEDNGEVWVHEYPNGSSYSTELRMIYDYYDADVEFDYDNGTVKFKDTDLDDNITVTADYSYFKKEEDLTDDDKTRLFITTNDDFVDYLDPDFYITPKDQDIDKDTVWDFTSNVAGKLTSKYIVDKDRGILEFYSGAGYGYDEYYYVPSNCRVTADYSYHTYYRLSNDGYGTLYFYDETIVADETPVYPDYTFVDVKIVNEGKAILEDGKISFVCRGYDDNDDGTVDQVLDLNRPWDVQEGTEDETYGKVAMKAVEDYTFDLTCSKDDAKTVLSNYKSASFGFDVEARSIFYGRIVWVVGGTSGSSYPSVTVGRKTFSSELSGKFYNVETSSSS